MFGPYVHLKDVVRQLAWHKDNDVFMYTGALLTAFFLALRYVTQFALGNPDTPSTVVIVLSCVFLALTGHFVAK
ncbi:g5108 [Coccomyxa elongata]